MGQDPTPYGQRLLSAVIDERARNNHERPFASVPLTADVRDGLRDVSYRAFANAINRCARWLASNLGASTTFENLAYMGPSDMRYFILAMAAVKSGHVMLFSSPRNSMDAHVKLLDEASVTKFLAPEKAFPIVDSLVKKRRMHRFVVPELWDLLDETPVEEVLFDHTFEQYRMNTWILLHTSGSTGLPKIIPIKHGYVTAPDAFSLVGSEIVQRCGSMRIFNPFPPFHMAGIIWPLAVMIWIDSTLVQPPPVALTSELVNSFHLHASVDYSFLPPSIVTDLSKNPEYLENTRRLKGLTYAGGPLSKPVGEMVCKQTYLNSSYGSTEMFAPPFNPRVTEDWQYQSFNLEASGIEMRESDGGFYELVIVRKRELELMQAIFVTFPDIQEYQSKDLFEKHATKPWLWRYVGRRDDILVFSNGEKFNPVTTEGTITASPIVTGCLVVGQGKFQAGLLVETKSPPKFDIEKRLLVEEIWPYVEKANKSAVKQGRIAKELIFFTDAEKPLARAAKGTVQRQKSISLYQEEIDELYRSAEKVGQGGQGGRLDLNTVESSRKSLKKYLVENLDLTELDPGEDFFKAGMDSLQAIALTRMINSSRAGPLIDVKQVYENPTMEKLTLSLHSTPLAMREDDDDLDTWTQMQQVFVNFSTALPRWSYSASGDGTSPRPSINEKVTMRSDYMSDSRSEDWSGLLSRFNQKIDGDGYDAATDKNFIVSMVPPDGGALAWLQVLASFLINLNNWGLVNSFGVYEAYYKSTFLKDYSESEISWIGTVQGSLLLIIGVFSGPLFDKGYFKSVLICSSVVIVFAQMMLSLSTQYYQIMLSQGILTGLCCGLLYVPSIALMPLYFRDRRGLAIGLALSGGSLGGVLYPIVFRELLRSTGFGWATRIIGFLALITLAVASVITRPLDSIRKPGREFFDMRALRELPIVLIMVSALLMFAALLVPIFFSTVYARAELGASENTSFYLVAVINAAQFFGRVTSGALSDHIGGELMMFGADVTAGLLCLCWAAVHNVGGFVAFQVFYGIASGFVATLPAVIIPYLCPTLAVLGTRMGMIYAAAGVGALFGVPIAAAASDASGGYLGAQLWAGLCALAGAAFFVVPGIVARRQRVRSDLTRAPRGQRMA